MDKTQLLSYTLKDAQIATGLSRSKLYKEISTGRLQSRKAGKRVLILAVDLQAWLNSLPVHTPTMRYYRDQEALFATRRVRAAR
jgi:excisionase family DNA binding protein